MGSIRVRKSQLFFDFRYLGQRCREQTVLPDNKSNRKKLEKVLKKIETEIALGSFDYAKYFPSSPMVGKIAKLKKQLSRDYRETPLFKDFADEWFEELEPTWRASTAKCYRKYIDNRLVPYFGEMEVSQITKSDILKFRSQTAKTVNGNLKPKTINKFVKCLKMILNEAADRFNFTPPTLMIKPLKEEKVHIAPFSLYEVNLMLSNVRPDWRDYLLVRFFTGMRTGEIDGLKWKYVDFTRRQILVRETWSSNSFQYTKNDGSQREIDMSTLVYETLLRRHQNRNPDYEMVFSLSNGSPVQMQNFLNRVWKPLLRYLKLDYRKPYQTRHTAATLWLASGENPNWIARQMGHSTTNMLFSVYARYVPNLTHQDGSAMDRLLMSKVSINSTVKKKITCPVKPENENKSVDGEAQFWDALLNESSVQQNSNQQTIQGGR